MKFNVLVLFITASISQLHAGSFTLDNITRPVGKACNDAKCILENAISKHPGAIALTGFATGCLMLTHAQHEYDKINQASKKLTALQKTFEDRDSRFIFPSEYADRSEQLKEAIKDYEEAQKKLEKLESNPELSSVRVKHKHSKSLAKTFSEADMKLLKDKFEQTSPSPEELEEELKKQENTPELQAARECLAKSKAALDTSFDQEFKNLKIQAVQKYYTKLWYCSLFIALISAASYGIYKAYPQLIKWLSPSVK